MSDIVPAASGPVDDVLFDTVKQAAGFFGQRPGAVHAEYRDTTGGADAKHWRQSFSSTSMVIATANDANDTTATAYTITRSGNTVSKHEITVGGSVVATFTSGGYNGIIGGTTPAAITGTTITANTQFVGTILTSNSTSAVAIKTTGGTQFSASNVANAVNNWSVFGGAAGSGVGLRATGTDTDVTGFIDSKGAGALSFRTNAGSVQQLRITHTASAVDYVQITGGATGSPGVVTISGAGSDSNIDTAIDGKGTGLVRIASHYTRYLRVTGSAGGNVTLAASDGNLVLSAPASGAGILSAEAPTFLNGTAVPAGGTAGAGYKFTSTSNLGMFVGSGAPTLAAAQGSIYLRTDGSSTSTRLYVNTDGSTTWTNFTSAA